MNNLKERANKIISLTQTKLEELQLMLGYIKFGAENIAKTDEEIAKIELQIKAKEKEIKDTETFIEQFSKYAETL